MYDFVEISEVHLKKCAENVVFGQMGENSEEQI